MTMFAFYNTILLGSRNTTMLINNPMISKKISHREIGPIVPSSFDFPITLSFNKGKKDFNEIKMHEVISM